MTRRAILAGLAGLLCVPAMLQAASDEAENPAQVLVRSLTAAPGVPSAEVDVRGVLDPAQGCISFDYTPDFRHKTGKFTIYRLFSCGKASAGVNRGETGTCNPWFLIDTPKTGKNYGVYGKLPMEPGKKVRIRASWNAEHLTLEIDGTIIGKKSISEPMPFGDTLYLGGAPGCSADGLIENLRISKESPYPPVLTLTPETPGAHSLGRRIRDEETHCAFNVESPYSPVAALIRPLLFRFQAGDRLYVETSTGTPHVVTAERDNELELKLPPSFNNQIVISRTTDNLFPPESVSSLKGWHISEYGMPLPTLGQGHEKFDVSDVVSGGTDTQGNSARFHDASLILTKNSPGGSLIAESPASELLPGKTYLFTAFYRTENKMPGSGFSLVVKLTALGQKAKYFHGLVMPRNTPPGKTHMATVRFAVPADWRNPQASVLLSVTGRPFEVAWNGFDLRECPVLLPVVNTPVLPQQKEPRLTPEELLAKLQSMPPHTAERRVENDGTVSLVLDGKIAPKFAYCGMMRTPGFKDFLDAGVKLQWVDVVTGKAGVNNWRGAPLWLGPGKYDFAVLDKRLETLLCMAPDAVVMLYVNLDPYPDFFQAHPEAVSVDGNGKPRRSENTFWQSYAAGSYRSEIAELLRALAGHLKNSPYGKAVAGIHLVGGVDGQWFPFTYDGSAGNLAAFRDWLKRYYRDDLAALRKAWGDEALNFETAALPTPEEFRQSPFFLDPGIPAQRRIIDSERFRCVAPVETVEVFARILKENMGRPFYVSMYYNDIIAGHDLGKNALREVLDSPWIDGIVGVVDYGWTRLPGFSGASVNLLDSPGLHGKILLAELDYRTECSNLWSARSGNAMGASVGTAENAAQQRRDTGIFLTHGQGAWMYALAGNGWPFPELMQPIREALKAAQLSAEQPRPDDRGDAVWFADERALDFLGQGWPSGASFRLLAHQVALKSPRLAFYRSGVKFDSFLLSDLPAAAGKYKLYVFVVSPSLTEAEIARIEKYLQKDGNVLVFLFDAGRCAPGGFTDTVRRLTGIRAKIDNDTLVTYRFDARSLTDPLAATLRYFDTETRGPALVIDDPEATILGYYTGTVLPGAAVKRHENWTGIYIGAPGGITPDFLHAAAREAGIRPTANSGDAVYAGNGFLVLHAMISGEKTLHWKGKHDLIDLADGSTVVKDAESFTFSAKVGETRWFRLK